MFYKMNVLGFINSSSMSEYSLDRCDKQRNPFPISVLSNIKQFGSDYVYDEYWIQKVAKLMQPDEILLVLPIEDYFMLKICNQTQTQQYYIQWCGVNNLISNRYENLRKFIKEVRIIWQKN